MSSTTFVSAKHRIGISIVESAWHQPSEAPLACFQKDPKIVKKWAKEEYPITEEVQ